VGTATLKNNIIASNIAGDDPTDGGVSDPPKQPGSDLYDITEGSTYATEGYNIVGTNDSVALTFPASPDNNGDGDPDEDTYNANMDIVGIGRQDGNPNRIQPSLGSLNNNSDEATPTRPLLSASPAIDMGENTDITGD
jgi:hypothetical protein